MTSIFDAQHKLVAAHISIKDYQLLQQLATNNKVSIAAYVRAIIVDALQEEEICISKPSSISHLQVV